MQDTDHTPPTTLPCPDWCTMPAGHGFDNEDPVAGTLDRFHTTTPVDHDFSAPGRLDGGRSHAGVWLASWERVHADGLRPVHATPVRLFIDTEAAMDAGLTAAEARAFAALILNAADEWDRITGASS